MDFNVKKFAADAGTFLSRAVQVGGGGRGGVSRRTGGRGGEGEDAGASSPNVGALAPGLAGHRACLRRPEPREMGAAWRPGGPGRRLPHPCCPAAAPWGQ